MAGIVLLARGHGYGHAARDLQIIRGLRQLRPNAEVVLASSASGVEYFRFQGIPCHDLGIEDRRDLGEQAVRRVWGFLQTLRDPDLVIADEWYGLSLLAPVFRLPLTMARRSMTRFSTDWRPLPRR
jgi:hypothetical protein